MIVHFSFSHTDMQHMVAIKKRWWECDYDYSNELHHHIPAMQFARAGYKMHELKGFWDPDQVISHCKSQGMFPLIGTVSQTIRGILSISIFCMQKH